MILTAGFHGGMNAQSAAPFVDPEAYPLPIDRGAVGLSQTLSRLNTRASLMLLVAHPDDEDGGMLTYESRGIGAEVTLLTLNRGEGGQNVMSGDYFDQLGEVRTQELLAAGRYMGVTQYWTRVADFGFSKTMQEALDTWGHDRVLEDCVRIVRMTRPLVVSSVFVGNVSDGHGQHQVAGLMAQEVYKAAGDPRMFPDQIKAGLMPWSPLKVYGRIPFARIGDKGIYDYATGQWEPIRFHNYVDDTWTNGELATTVQIPEGTYDPRFGMSYLQLARTGLNSQKSQNGGIAYPFPSESSSGYHRWATRVNSPNAEQTFFDGIDVTLGGIADYAPKGEREDLRAKLGRIADIVTQSSKELRDSNPAAVAPLLADGLAQLNVLIQTVESQKGLTPESRYNILYELKVKQKQFNTALVQALGLEALANITAVESPHEGFGGGVTNDVGNLLTIVPGQKIFVQVKVADQGAQQIDLDALSIFSGDGKNWEMTSSRSVSGSLKAGQSVVGTYSFTAPEDLEATKAYFSRAQLEQPYYDIEKPAYEGWSTSPYPLTMQAGFHYHGVPVTITRTVQAMHRYTGPGVVPEPLLAAPPVSLWLSSVAGIVPEGSSSFDLKVMLHSNVKGPAKGSVRLKVPEGWVANPSQAEFSTLRDGEEQGIAFTVTPQNVQAKPYTITALAEYKGKEYRTGYKTTGYVGLRPYPFYRASTYRLTGVDAKIAPGLKVGYIMGTGDEVPESLESLGVHASILSSQDITSGNLSSYDVLILGIRTYAARPELKVHNSRLLEYVKNGGTVIVQYQTAEYAHEYGPYPLTLNGDAEKVVEEKNRVVLDHDPILSWPNQLSGKDFDGWVEERGHGFLGGWDRQYRTPTETHDTDQDPQRGGLVYARYGKGVYIYTAFALYRQLPEGVPGAYRLLANLLSAGKNPKLSR